MGFSASQALAASLGAWVAWGLFKRFALKGPVDHIPGPAPESWLIGNLENFLNPDSWAYVDQMVKKYGRVWRVTGILKESYLFVYDPKALYHIVVKQHGVFEESEDLLRLNGKVFGDGLLSTVGDHHRRQRKLLNPAFSAAHMREMIPIFYNVAHKLESSIAQQVGDTETEVEMLSWLTRTALELIAQSGFGYSFDKLEPGGSEHPYAASARNFFAVSNNPGIMIARSTIYPYIHQIGSSRFQRAIVNMLPWPRLHQLRDITDIMHKTSVDIFESAKRSIKDGKDFSDRPGGGKDIMSILIKANMNALDEDKLPDEELIAQISTFTLAAMDTTSNAIARILDLLCENTEAQERLRQEVTEAYAANGGDLDYDTLNGLPYMEAVVRESLRYHTPIPYLPRQAMRDAILPLATPIKTLDGREVTEIFVPKGMEIVLSLFDCNRDPDIWGPDAEEWKPERWFSPLPPSVAEARVPGIYSNLMTFLGGGRACIGFKFSQLEIKIVLSLLIQKFKFAPSGKKVLWLSNGITQPTIDDPNLPYNGRRKTQLPLKVSLA